MKAFENVVGRMLASSIKGLEKQGGVGSYWHFEITDDFVTAGLEQLCAARLEDRPGYSVKVYSDARGFRFFVRKGV